MMKPCDKCGGDGKIPIGEHHVTRDMAIDAGEPSMEGVFHSYEYGDCPDCEGTGLVPDLPPMTNGQKVASLMRNNRNLTMNEAICLLGVRRTEYTATVLEANRIIESELTTLPTEGKC